MRGYKLHCINTVAQLDAIYALSGIASHNLTALLRKIDFTPPLH